MTPSGADESGTLPVPAEARTDPSFVVRDGAALWLERSAEGTHLAVMTPPDDPLSRRLSGEAERVGDFLLFRGGLGAENAALREVLPNLRPRTLGLATSAGFGDRLGVATPGHVRALVRHGAGIAPMFAQQSIREMARTRRSPQQVLDDTTWGAFEAGWQGVVGADADHQKTLEDIDRCAEAGFTLFTVDPGEQVDDRAHGALPQDLEARVAALPWAELETTRADFERYAGPRLELDTGSLVLEREAMLRAGAKYARAVLHVTKLYRQLEGRGIPFELEVSVDETEMTTSHAEHAVIALELARLGRVRARAACLSRAPRCRTRQGRSSMHLRLIRPSRSIQG